MRVPRSPRFKQIRRPVRLPQLRVRKRGVTMLLKHIGKMAAKLRKKKDEAI